MASRPKWYTEDETEVLEEVTEVSNENNNAETSQEATSSVTQPERKGARWWLNLMVTLIVAGVPSYGAGYVHGHLIDVPKFMDAVQGEFSRYGLANGGEKSIDVRQTLDDGTVTRTTIMFNSGPKTVAMKGR